MKKLFQLQYIFPVILVIFVIALLGIFYFNNTKKPEPILTHANDFGPVGPPTNCNFYASPTGTSNGDGSIGNPWDLQTALYQPPSLVPGSTLCLKGGTYYGKYKTTITGSSNSPITVRSAPGEWAKIDGYKTTTITQDVPASTSGAHTIMTFGNIGGIHDGVGLMIGNEEVSIDTFISSNQIQVNRGNPAPSHPAGTLVTVRGNTLIMEGSDTNYRDFEIDNSLPDRVDPTPNAQNSFYGRGIAIWHDAPRTKLINLIIHNGENGIFSTIRAINTEFYGNMIYNNGYADANGSLYGHGIYLQNNTGTKEITNTLLFNNYNFGAQEESVSGNTINVHNLGVIVFNNTLLIGTQSGITDGIEVKDSHFYVHPVRGGGLRLGYTSANTGAIVTNNYFAGGQSGWNMSASNWQSLVVTGNTFAPNNGSESGIINFETASGGNVNWNNNRYYDNSTVYQNCPTPTARAAFGYNSMEGVCGGKLAFTEWQSLSGFDASVTNLGTSAPSDPNGYFYSISQAPTKVFVQPNQYETGRANVIIQNAPRASSANINLSSTGLTNGQSFVIKNAQNIFGASVYSGTYNSSSPSVNVSLTSAAATTVEQASGYSLNISSTCPEFCAFVVLPVYGGTPPPSDTTPPVLSSGAPTGAQASGTTSVNMTLTTNETATCKYGTVANTAYASIANTFTTTGSTSHSKTLTGLTNGSSYTYYIRCQDSSSNANSSDYTISFSVSAPAGDTTPPTVSVTAPTNNATVSGSATTVSATATDNVAVVGVQFKLDGSNLGTEDTSSPYSITWNTTQASNASHTITATARDAAGNSTTSTAITVTVNNTTPPSTVATPTISPNGGSFSSTQSVTLSSATSGASIRYTTDGSTPSSTVGTLYSSAFTVASTTTVKAIAYKSGSTNSSVSSATFTITSTPSGGGGGGSSGGGGGGTSKPPVTTPNNSKRLINSQGTYYLVESGQRRGITSPGILASCGFALSDAKTATTLDTALPLGSLLLPCGGALVKSKEDPTVYLISLGKRYAFTSSAVFTGLGFKFSSVLLVTNPELQALSKSSDLNNGSSAHLPETNINVNGTIYWIDGSNKKQPYSSLEVWNSWHVDNDFTTVVPANQADLSLPTGSNVIKRVLE